jgi:alginate O-acetyltransferase complex protein AlgI
LLGVLALSTAVDFVIARRIEASEDEAQRRRSLVLSVCTNLGMLGFFKYCDFFLDSTARLIRQLGFEPHLPTLALVLPVGISFYTFQTLSYTIDV